MLRFSLFAVKRNCFTRLHHRQARRFSGDDDVYFSTDHRFYRFLNRSQVQIGITPVGILELGGEVTCAEKLCKIGDILTTEQDVVSIRWEGFKISDGDELYHTVWENVEGNLNMNTFPFPSSNLKRYNTKFFENPSGFLDSLLDFHDNNRKQQEDNNADDPLELSISVTKEKIITRRGGGGCGAAQPAQDLNDNWIFEIDLLGHPPALTNITAEVLHKKKDDTKKKPVDDTNKQELLMRTHHYQPSLLTEEEYFLFLRTQRNEEESNFEDRYNK